MAPCATEIAKKEIHLLKEHFELNRPPFIIILTSNIIISMRKKVSTSSMSLLNIYTARYERKHESVDIEKNSFISCVASAMLICLLSQSESIFSDASTSLVLYHIHLLLQIQISNLLLPDAEILCIQRVVFAVVTNPLFH